MQIFVRADETHLVEVGAEATVQEVKEVMQSRLGASADEMRVVFNGKQLEDEEQLSAAGVADEQTLYILMRLLGGAKKRKKKTYTKPKKLKHKHKKIKMRVLKLYKVKEDGTVQRLRKDCPQCGPGTFLSKHTGRVYCGHCHSTYQA